MAIPLRQSARVGWYLFNQKLHKREKFPLLVELEPLFACNLKCPGCGKIQQPHDLLRQRSRSSVLSPQSRRAAHRWCRSRAANR